MFSETPRFTRPNQHVAISVLIILGAVILMLPAIFNGFPFVFQDSADYLIFTPRLYRSPFYGLLISFFHLNQFIWAPIIAQALIGSHLIYVMVKIQNISRVKRTFLLLVSLLTVASPLPYFVGFVMPDIFTAYMFVVLYLIGFYFLTFPIITRIYFLLLACVSIAAHLSHLAMAIGIVFLFIPLAYWGGRSWQNIRMHTAFLLLPILLTACAYLSFNYFAFHSTSLSPAGQTFFLANLIEHGPAHEYLQTACPKAGYKICTKVDQLPVKAEDFLWKEGYLNELGGFSEMAAESRAVTFAVVKEHPKEVITMMFQNFAEGLNTHKPAAELAPHFFPTWTSIFTVLNQKFGPDALSGFEQSTQMKDQINHVLIESIDEVIIPTSFILLVILGLYAAIRRRRDLTILTVFIICSVLGNTLLCVTVSGIHDRYQARVSWLLVMTAFLVVLSLLADKKLKMRNPLTLS
ncbi:MAG: hypothetical protein WAO98_03865 [Alphaproteobacteria bacterium]